MLCAKEIMRIFILTFILLIGLYALLRNNVSKLPEQIIWIINPDIFYKTFIPLLMIVSAISSFFKKEKMNLFFLSVTIMILDAVHRLSVLINHLYVFYTCEEVESLEPIGGYTTFITSLWPSHIMFLIELVLIVCLVLSFKSHYGNEANS
jgi:hypothetical protein